MEEYERIQDIRQRHEDPRHDSHGSLVWHDVEWLLGERERLIAVAPGYHAAAVALAARHDAKARAANFSACGCDDCAPFRAAIEKTQQQ